MLLDIWIQNMIPEVQINAPVLWKLVCYLTCTQKQAHRNKNKNSSEPVALYTPAIFLPSDSFWLLDVAHANLMLNFSRSHAYSKLLKLLTVYFKSCGLTAKVFNTLHALGITMCQKWAYDGIEQLSACVCKGPPWWQCQVPVVWHTQ